MNFVFKKVLLEISTDFMLVYLMILINLIVLEHCINCRGNVNTKTADGQAS
jgi:hypothetical protein